MLSLEVLHKMNRFEFLKKIKFPKFGGSVIRQIIFGVVTVVLGVVAFAFARSFTACWNLTGLPGLAPASCGASNATTQFNPEGTPIATEEAVLPAPLVAAPEVALPPAWDGASRINILFFGLRGGEISGEGCPACTDTLILFTIDPITKTAGMLSIPRDLWVNIPGFGYSRINTAYPNGEGSKLPGGGAGLIMKTVEQLLGVPVHYYAQVDFDTFSKMVDRVGCIKVVPTEKLTLDPVGGGTDHVVITPGGERELCGWKALAYARIRKTAGGDTDRSKRQQQVIFALQQKIFDPQVFPSLIVQAPQIYSELSSGIHTNMPIEDAIKLAVLGKDIAPASIKTGIIDTTMVTFDNTTLGGQAASVMKPMSDKIRVLRDEVFTSSGPLSPIAQGDAVSLMRAEEARVRIVDGTFTPGLDQRAGAWFQAQGMNVTEVGAATEVYSSTTVIVYGPKLYTLRYMQSTFGLSHTQIRFNPDPSSSVDIEVRLGADLAGNVP
jgi:polyisoprenyl-teichoic acid--peptidoglycan teichoic acid transferase